MGLLNKAISAEKESAVSSPQISSIINALNSADSGLDFPTVLFTKAAEEFSISKGALLLPEKDGNFIPWSVIGYDETTSRRIRIPESLINSIKDSSAYSFIELRDSEINLMKDFFSFREYSVTKSVLIAPLKAENKIIALLFVNEGNILDFTNKVKREMLEELSVKAGPLLHSKREKIVTKFESFQRDVNDISLVIKQFSQESENKSFLVISYSVKDFLEHLTSKDPSVIAFRIMQDIRNLTTTMLSGKGIVSSHGSDKLIFLINGERKEEAELLIHQIGLSLGYFFKTETKEINFPYTILSYPHECSSLEEIIQKL